MVFRIDFVHIVPHFVKKDDGRDGIADIKDWRKNLYGLVGARRHCVEEIGSDYPPVGMFFSRNLDDETHESTKFSVAVSPGGQLLLNGPFLPLVFWEYDTMQLDIKLYYFTESSEQTVMLDVTSYHNHIREEFTETDQPLIFRTDGSYGAVEVGYSKISMAVYVRFVASIVIPSTASPLDIYGHITVEEHFH